MAEPIKAQCVGRRRLEVWPQQEDGNYLVKIVLGEVERDLASLVLIPEEARKLRDALVAVVED